MKKIVLPTLLVFVCFLILGSLFPTNISADNKDCLATWTSERYACAGAYSKCYEQCGAASGIAPESCYKACDNTSKACEKEANANFEACKNASKQTTTNSDNKDLTLYKKALTCDEIWKIVGTQDCPDWAINNDLGGVWCNITSLERAPWTAGLAPKYTFTPGACGEASQPSGQKEEAKPTGQNGLSKGPSLLSIGYKWIESLYLNKFANLVKEFEVIGVEAQKSAEFRERELSEKQPSNNQTENSLNDEALWQYGVDPKDIWERKPKISDTDVEEVKRRQASQPDSPFTADIIKGQVQIKLPGSNEWADLRPGDKIPSGSTIFTGMDTTTILGIRDKGVMEVLSFTEVIVSEKGLEQAESEGKTTTDIGLRTGEIEVNVGKGVYTAGGRAVDVEAVYTTSSVRGTHFWVKHDDKRHVEVIGVYEGEVGVKTKDGKTSYVTPNRDKPGIIVVAQKLSFWKLTIIGAVVAVLIIGAGWFLKRKNLSKLGNTVRKKR